MRLLHRLSLTIPTQCTWRYVLWACCVCCAPAFTLGPFPCAPAQIHGVLLRSDPARAASVRSSELTDYAVEGGKYVIVSGSALLACRLMFVASTSSRLPGCTFVPARLTLDWSAERASEGLWGFLRTNIIIILLGVQAASVSKDIDNVLVRFICRLATCDWLLPLTSDCCLRQIKPMDAVTSFLRPAMNQALDNATEERAIWLGRRDGPDFFTRLLLLTLQSLTDNLNPEVRPRCPAAPCPAPLGGTVRSRLTRAPSVRGPTLPPWQPCECRPSEPFWSTSEEVLFQL